MRELRPPIDVAQREHAFCAGAIGIVHRDEALRVEIDPPFAAAQVVRIRRASRGNEKVRAPKLAIVGETNRDTARRRFEALRLNGDLETDSFAAERLLERSRGVGILVTQEVVTSVDDGHVGPESAKHLAELAADVATPENDQVSGQVA